MKRSLSGSLLILLSFFSFQTTFAQTAEYRLMHQGNACFNARKYKEAGQYYLQALKKNPNNTRATFNLADTYLAQNDTQAADSLYNIVTQTEKNSQIRSMAWHNRGYIRQTQALHLPKQQQQLLRIAIDHYKEALRLNPKDNDTRYNLALCQKQLKESEQEQQQQSQKDQQKGQDNQPQQQKSEAKVQPQQSDVQQTEQYLNLARQAERRALEKLNGQKPRQKGLDKNW